MSRIIGRVILRYDEVSSTNDLARELALKGELEGLVVTAEHQTSGRGRMGRTWLAPPRTSVLLSILLRPPLPAYAASSIVQMAALATASALRETVALTAPPPLPNITLKWPNDVLLKGRKCAGILLETTVEGEGLGYVILGLGINVNFSMRECPELLPFATTLADEVGHAVDREGLEQSLLTNLDSYYARLRSGKAELSAIFEEWRSQLGTLGHEVRVGTPSGIEEGVALDVDTDGALLLRRGEDLIRLYSGEVTVLEETEQRRLE